PAVALLTLDLGCVITASHNPPEYNGVKFFERDGQKLPDSSEEEIEALLERAPVGGGTIDDVGVATDSYLEHVVERFGTDLTGMHVVVDCANGAYSGIAPKAFDQLGARTTTIGDAPDGTNINVGCGATNLVAISQKVVDVHADLGVAFDGDVTGDGLAAALALCGALEGRTLEEAAAVMPRYPQAKENVHVGRRVVSDAVQEEVARLNAKLDGRGRVLVRPSGTEPVIRVLAEAPDEAEAANLCGTIAALVRRELG